MDELQCSEELVEEELVVLRSEIIVCFNNMMEIRFHELENHIDISEFSPRWRENNVLNFHNIWMPNQSQKLDLSKNSRGIRDVLKDIIDLLDRHSFSRASVHCSSNHAIASFPNHFLNLIPGCLPILSKKIIIQRAL